jgi:hypothetical protein
MKRPVHSISAIHRIYSFNTNKKLLSQNAANEVFMYLFSGAMAKLRTATIRFVMSVCLSVCPSVRLPVRLERLGYQWTDFH